MGCKKDAPPHLACVLPPVIAGERGKLWGRRVQEAGQEEAAGIRPLRYQPGTFRAKYARTLAEEFRWRGTMQQPWG